MATVEELKKTIKVVMFDQYGTVVDMQGGLTALWPFIHKVLGQSSGIDARVTK